MERCWWLLFVVGAFALAQQTTSENNQPAVVEGSVIHAITKEPVQKAHVTLELSDRGHQSALVATTDEEGRFRFADVKPGSYNLTVEKTGFLEGGYGETNAEDKKSLLKVSDGDRIEDLVLLLFPGGTISGKVEDSDGDAVAGDAVTLWIRRRSHGQVSNSHVAETTTNQGGEYSFYGLSPGTYYVSANAGAWGYAVRQIPVDSSGKVTKMHELATFYPAALSVSEAQSVRIECGQEQSGIDIRIRQGRTLSVRGRIAGTGGWGSDYSVSAGVEEGAGFTSEGGRLLPNGDFIFDDLPPGKHRLTLLEHGQNGVLSIGNTDVELTDEDVTGVVITPFKPAQVRVRVVMESEEDKPLTTGSVSLLPRDFNGMFDETRMQYQPQNGTYVIDDVPPGQYKVWFNNAPDCYVKSVQSGGRMLDRDSVDIRDGATLDLLMILSRNMATVIGDVEIAEEGSARSAHVLLISPDTTWEWDRIRSADLDRSSHFSMEEMPPGKYLAFAVEDDDSDLWNNADFVKLLQSKGTEVELHEKDHATVHLKLIKKDETDDVRKRLGI